jgi:hypothetical protein
MHPTSATAGSTPVLSRRLAVLRALGIGIAASTSIGIGVALAVPAGGRYTPGLVVGDTRVGLPYAFTPR